MLRMEDILRQYLAGQDKAIRFLGRSLRKAAAGMVDPNRPIVFFFIGSDDVSKTILARALAEVLYGDKKALVCFEMSEYQDTEAPARLRVDLGKAIKSLPFRVILLHDIEKAHRDLHNLYYEIRDVGEIPDGRGNLLDLKKSIVIVTTNVGSRHLTQLCEEEYPNISEAWVRQRQSVCDDIATSLAPQFLYRADFVMFEGSGAPVSPL